MSRNTWCAFILVAIVLVTLIAAVVVGVAVDKPLPCIITIVVIGVVGMLSVTVYCASEFNIRAHEEPTAVVAPTQPPAPPPDDDSTHTAHTHRGLITAIVVVAALILAMAGVGGWILLKPASEPTLEPIKVATSDCVHGCLKKTITGLPETVARGPAECTARCVELGYK